MLAVQSIIPPESSTGLLKLRGACYHALSGRPGPAPRPLRGALGNVSASSQQLRQTASRGSCARRGSPSPELSWGVFSAAAAPRSPGDSPLALWPQEALPTRPVWEQGPSRAGPDRRGKERDGQPICCPRAPPWPLCWAAVPAASPAEESPTAGSQESFHRAHVCVAHDTGAAEGAHWTGAETPRPL